MFLDKVNLCDNQSQLQILKYPIVFFVNFHGFVLVFLKCFNRKKNLSVQIGYLVENIFQVMCIHW